MPSLFDKNIDNNDNKMLTAQPVDSRVENMQGISGLTRTCPSLLLSSSFSFRVISFSLFQIHFFSFLDALASLDLKLSVSGSVINSPFSRINFSSIKSTGLSELFSSLLSILLSSCGPASQLLPDIFTLRAIPFYPSLSFSSSFSFSVIAFSFILNHFYFAAFFSWKSLSLSS